MEFPFLFFFSLSSSSVPLFACGTMYNYCTRLYIGARMGMRILLRYHAVVIPRGRQECDFWLRGWTAPSSYASRFARDVWTRRFFAVSFFFFFYYHSSKHPSFHYKIIHCEKSRITSLLSSKQKYHHHRSRINRDTWIDSRSRKTVQSMKDSFFFFLKWRETNIPKEKGETPPPLPPCCIISAWNIVEFDPARKRAKEKR